MKLFNLCLTLFDEGGALFTAATGQAGQNSNQGVVMYGVQEQPQETPVEKSEVKETANPIDDRKSQFDKLINEEYKDLFNERIQNIINKRFKETKTLQEQVEKVNPLLDILGSKYGVDGKDVDKLSKALEEDKKFFEDEAAKEGLSVDQYKDMKRLERENAQFKQSYENAQKIKQKEAVWNEWSNQADEAKVMYPNFELKKELENPAFAKLLGAGVDVKSAYQAIHMDEIVGGAMAYTAKTVEKKVADNVRARGSRPSENGLSSQTGVMVKNDVSRLTASDRAEIAKRVARGETIKF